MRSALFWGFTQRRLVVPSRNVGTTLPLYAVQNCKTAKILYRDVMNLLQQGAVHRGVSSELHSPSLEISIGLRKVGAKCGCEIQILTEPPVAKSLVYVPQCFFRCELRCQLSRLLVQNGTLVRIHTDTRSEGNDAVTKGLNTAARKIQQAFFKQTFYRFKSQYKSLYYWQSVNSS
jgi:hypothetical protein